MKNALILHGTDNNSTGNWFPWLATELMAKGYLVYAPDLPNSEFPSVAVYKDFIIEHEGWHLNGESVIVGHSSGAVATLFMLQELSLATPIAKCILVSAFKDNLGSIALDGLFTKEFDFAKIRKNCKEFIFVHSDTDPYCPVGGARYLCDMLGGQFVMIPSQGHFNLEHSSSYKKFPKLLEYI